LNGTSNIAKKSRPASRPSTRNGACVVPGSTVKVVLRIATARSLMPDVVTASASR
jgi:hypothetical protein